MRLNLRTRVKRLEDELGPSQTHCVFGQGSTAEEANADADAKTAALVASGAARASDAIVVFSWLYEEARP